MDYPHSDELYAGTTTDGTISVIGGITTSLVREIARRHELSPLAGVAVGRLATGATLLGASLKGQERVSLQIVSDGPIRSLVAEVSLLENGRVGTRAYTHEPKLELPRNAVGSVDVRHAVGSGRLHVTKSFKHGQPFVGVVALRSGEIDDDLAAYFIQSQQIPGVVALGVVENEGELISAGGLIAQVMPSADESVFEELERRSRTMPDISHMLRNGASARDLVEALTGTATLRSEQTFGVDFYCRCTRERVETALLSLGKEDLERLADERPITEATCEYCREVYEISADEVRTLALRLQ
jgi:molecular chaperone Hsp33